MGQLTKNGTVLYNVNKIREEYLYFVRFNSTLSGLGLSLTFTLGR